MPILLCRVDDRLIHGQVVVGWGPRLGLDYIAVVDDELAASEWERDLYRAGLPQNIDGRFVSTEEAIDMIARWKDAHERGFILTRDIETMCRLAESGVLADIEVNLGGLHDAPGRRRVLPYLFLGERERMELRRLRRTGVRVRAQDVPGARPIELDELIEARTD